MQEKSFFKNTQPILIVTEDTESARRYLESRIKDLRLTNVVVVQPSKGSSPDKVVQTAIDICLAAKEDAKWNGKMPYAKAYCVMDVDEHDGDSQNPQKYKLRKAIETIHTNNNNPKRAFELVKIFLFFTRIHLFYN